MKMILRATIKEGRNGAYALFGMGPTGFGRIRLHRSQIHNFVIHDVEDTFAIRSVRDAFTTTMSMCWQSRIGSSSWKNRDWSTFSLQESRGYHLSPLSPVY